jgi:hypothetical protein
MRALCAAVALLSSGALPAATVGGRLGYPSEALPAMIVVAQAEQRPRLAEREVPRAQGARFEAYPADTSPLPSTRPPNFNGADAAVRRARGAIERAVVRGPDFAGRAVVARWACGRDCERWAIVDMATGGIGWVDDTAVQPARRNFPCDAEALEYREDSRLLRVHRLEGDQVVTREVVWWEDRLELGAESAQSAQQFCGR